MKKGFTLIELLAVIVILSIIAVIAVPIVIDIIENTKTNSVKSSANMYLKAAELYISNAQLNKVKIEPGTYSIMEDGNICIGIIEESSCNGEVIKIDVKGNKPTSGKIAIDGKSVKIDYLEISGYIYYKNNDEYIVEKGKKQSVESTDGIITLDSSTVPYLTNYQIYGNSIQETDTIQSAGNLVTDSTHEHYGKYEIPIKVTGKNLFNIDNIVQYESRDDYSTTHPNIKPLKKIGDILTVGGRVGYYNSNLLPLPKGEKVYISGEIVGDDKFNMNIVQTLPDRSAFNNLQPYVLNIEDKFNYEFSISYDENIYGLNIFSSNAYKETNGIKNFQISLTNDVEYEPYKEEIYSIYLEEPLRCVGKVCDYIDFESGKVVRYIEETYNILNEPKLENIDLPKIKINEGVSNIFIDTDIKPNKVSVNYYK